MSEDSGSSLDLNLTESGDYSDDWTESGDVHSNGVWEELYSDGSSVSPPPRVSARGSRQSAPRHAISTPRQHQTPEAGRMPVPVPEPDYIDPRFDLPYVPPTTFQQPTRGRQSVPSVYQNSATSQQHLPPVNRTPKTPRATAASINQPFQSGPHHASQKPPPQPANNLGPAVPTASPQLNMGYQPPTVESASDEDLPRRPPIGNSETGEALFPGATVPKGQKENLKGANNSLGSTKHAQPVRTIPKNPGLGPISNPAAADGTFPQPPRPPEPERIHSKFDDVTYFPTNTSQQPTHPQPSAPPHHSPHIIRQQQPPTVNRVPSISDPSTVPNNQPSLPHGSFQPWPQPMATQQLPARPMSNSAPTIPTTPGHSQNAVHQPVAKPPPQPPAVAGPPKPVFPDSQEISQHNTQYVGAGSVGLGPSNIPPIPGPAVSQPLAAKQAPVIQPDASDKTPSARPLPVQSGDPSKAKNPGPNVLLPTKDRPVGDLQATSIAAKKQSPTILHPSKVKKASPKQQSPASLAVEPRVPDEAVAHPTQPIILPPPTPPVDMPDPPLSQYSSPAPSVFKEGVVPEVVIDLRKPRIRPGAALGPTSTTLPQEQFVIPDLGRPAHLKPFEMPKEEPKPAIPKALERERMRGPLSSKFEQPYNVEAVQPNPNQDDLAGMHLPSPSFFRMKPNVQPRQDSFAHPKPRPQDLPLGVTKSPARPTPPWARNIPAQASQQFIRPGPPSDDLPIPVDPEDHGPFMSGALRPGDRPPEPEAIDPKFESILPAPVGLPPPPPPDVVHPYPPIHNAAVAGQPKLKAQNQGKKNMKTKVGQGAAIHQTSPVVHPRPQAQTAAGAIATPAVNQPQPVTSRGQLLPQSRPDPGKQAFTPEAPKVGQVQQLQRPQGNTKKPGKPETFIIDNTPIVVPKAAAGASQSFDVRDLTHQAIANGQKIPSGPPPPRRTSPLKPVHFPSVPQGVNGAPVPELPIQPQKQGRALNLPKPSGPKGPAVPLNGVKINSGVEENHFDPFGGQKQPPLPPPPPRGPGAGFMGPESEDSGHKEKPQPRDTKKPVPQRVRPSYPASLEDEDVQSNRVSLDSVPTVPFKPTKRNRSVRHKDDHKKRRRRASHHREYSYADSIGLSSIVTTKDKARRSGRVRRRDLEANAPHRKQEEVSSWSSAESDPRVFVRRESAAPSKYHRQASRAYYRDDRHYSSQEHPKPHQRARKSSQGLMFVRKKREYIEPDGKIRVYREPARLVREEPPGHRRESIHHRRRESYAPSRQNSRAPPKVVYEGSAPVKLGLAALFGGNKRR